MSQTEESTSELVARMVLMILFGFGTMFPLIIVVQPLSGFELQGSGVSLSWFLAFSLLCSNLYLAITANVVGANAVGDS